MLFMYTEGSHEFSGRSQFQEMFGISPDQERFQVHYIDSCEHTPRLVSNQTVWCDRICDWFLGRWHRNGSMDFQPSERRSLSAETHITHR